MIEIAGHKITIGDIIAAVLVLAFVALILEGLISSFRNRE